MTLYARDWIEYHSITTPDKLAMVDLMSKRRFTYAEAGGPRGRISQI